MTFRSAWLSILVIWFSLKHKLPANTSIFTAEAWAVYQSLNMVESSGEHKAVIFSDSKSPYFVLGKKSCSHYIIPLIKSKFHSKSGFSIQIVWIPSHVSIIGNEMADAAAIEQPFMGENPNLKFHTRISISQSNAICRAVFFDIWKKNFARRALYISRIATKNHLNRVFIGIRSPGGSLSPLTE